MKHHNEKELAEKKHSAHASDPMRRCDGCGQKVKEYRTNECPYCHRRFCHICWSAHYHIDDYVR